MKTITATAALALMLGATLAHAGSSEGYNTQAIHRGTLYSWDPAYAAPVALPTPYVWNTLTEGTDRMYVPGGWIYRTKAGTNVAMVFVPLWGIELIQAQRSHIEAWLKARH